MLPVVCERFRAYVSLSLDGELAELEQLMLDSHLERCAGCGAFAVEAGASTAALRAAEPVAPRHVITVPALYRRTPLRAFQAAAAAAVAVAAAAVALTVTPAPSRTPQQTTITRAQALAVIGAQRQFVNLNGIARNAGRNRTFPG